ncbi:hypothetical protein GE061_005792 [Apolygus lucorum]|uniref:Uncharacterized protein n=1 Tax=Apolygus lucorum TaxID=248454 RepID=A0A8S9WYN8_APOLU|nr:hypothetical protein GE061_005792 [Apolygus lucorum]
MATLSPETIADLMSKFTSIMDKTLEDKLKEITKNLATKSDVGALTQKVDALQIENNTLRGEVVALKSELLSRDNRVDFIDSMIRRDNLIFNGLIHDGRNELLTVIKAFIQETLGISRQITIKDVICLGGRRAGAPLLVKFCMPGDITEILQKTNRLKGTNFGINRDYPESVRVARRNLFAIKKELQRLGCTHKVLVRSQYLIVDDKFFSWSNKDGIVYKDGDGLQLFNSLVGVNIGRFVQEQLKRNSTHPGSAAPHHQGVPSMSSTES